MRKGLAVIAKHLSRLLSVELPLPQLVNTSLSLAIFFFFWRGWGCWCIDMLSIWLQLIETPGLVWWYVFVRDSNDKAHSRTASSLDLFVPTFYRIEFLLVTVKDCLVGINHTVIISTTSKGHRMRSFCRPKGCCYAYCRSYGYALWSMDQWDTDTTMWK